MPETSQLPHYIISSAELAEWIEGQKDLWWYVDGDHLLMSKLDFSCPSEELAAELKKHKSNLMVFDGSEASTANGETIDACKFETLANTDNNYGARDFLMSWVNKDGKVVQWLLAEDPNAIEDSKESA